MMVVRVFRLPKRKFEKGCLRMLNHFQMMNLGELKITCIYIYSYIYIYIYYSLKLIGRIHILKQVVFGTALETQHP